MYVKEAEIKSASSFGGGWAASQDARNTDIANASHYPESKKIKAQGLKYALELVYAAKDIYINYRKKFIAVKVDAARVTDKRTLAELEADWTLSGITKLVTPQGVVYRIPA